MELVQEAKDWEIDGFLGQREAHFYASEAGLELDPLGETTCNLDECDGELTGPVANQVAESIAEILEQAHVQSLAYGQLTPYQVFVDPQTGAARLLPAKLFQLISDALREVAPQHACHDTLKPLSPASP